MENLKLSPRGIAKVIDLELNYVIALITGKSANRAQGWMQYEKEVKSIQRDYGNQLYALSELPEFLIPTSVYPDKCILREYVRQFNEKPEYIYFKMTTNKRAVKCLDFVDKHKYYDMFLTPENRIFVLKKLSQLHIAMHGESSTYKNFIASIKSYQSS